MTSEVLILNKRALILAADSAATTKGGKHPRYSKSAIKIFELNNDGSLAAMVFGAGSLDLVPWDLIIKEFRASLGPSRLDTVAEYKEKLIEFLDKNDSLFPASIRRKSFVARFDLAIDNIVQQAADHSRALVETKEPLVDRQKLWATLALKVRANLDKLAIRGSLTKTQRDVEIKDPFWAARVQTELSANPALEAFWPPDLAELGLKMLYADLPENIGPSTGVVLAGFGSTQLFPAFCQLRIEGHIAETLSFRLVEEYVGSHEQCSMIVPFAQKSMIETFVSGFSNNLKQILGRASRESLKFLTTELVAKGGTIPAGLEASLIRDAADSFEKAWVEKNFKLHSQPLTQVLAWLSIEEMAHLAETLLTLQSLKERVTSPSETVGGPIDVAAITKHEGLVWIKRKHHFDPELNVRYLNRLKRSLLSEE